MSTPKKPRTIPVEHLCPVKDCGGRMTFTHSVPNKDGVIKRRKCKFCGYEDRALLKVEVVKLLEVAQASVRHRTIKKKDSAKRATSHGSASVIVGNPKPNTRK